MVHFTGMPRPLERQMQKHGTGIHCVEYAKKGRSLCRGCSSKIAEGQLRYGADINNEKNWDHQAWYHLKCVPADILRQAGSKGEKLMKMERLEQEDSKAIADRFAGLSK